MLRSNKKRIVVVSHEASNTGAPLLLIQLLKFIESNYDCVFEIVISRGGPLETEFKKLGKVFVLKPEGYSNSRGFHRFRLILNNRIRLLKVFGVAAKSDVIFCNSIINGEIIKWLRYTRKPIYTYVHELEQVIRMYLQSGHIRPTLKYTNTFFYPCNKVRDTLINSFGVHESKLARLNYYFPLHLFENMPDSKSGKDKEFHFCGIGTASYRKGTDLFIAIARDICQKNPGYKFVWIGGFESNEDAEKYKQLANVDGYSVVEFVGPMEPGQVRLQYSKYDALILTSREDPYPLVVLEAAYNKKASFVFKDSGGVYEFVNDCGWVLSQFSTDKMADCILSLTKDNLCERGLMAYEKAIEMHSSTNLLEEQLFFLKRNKE